MTSQMPQTGYPSIEKPWLKYYSEEATNSNLPECTIYEYLWESNKNHLNDVALIYFGRKITYRKLFESIDKAAAAFSAIGVKKGDVVAICSVTIPEVIYCIYALNRLGAVSNMIDPRTNMERIRQYINVSKTKHIVSIDKCLPKIEKLKADGFSGEIVIISAMDSLFPITKMGYLLKRQNKKIGTGVSWNQFLKLTASLETSTYEKGKPATIIYTSGTTGIPKGALLSDDTFNILALQYQFLGVKYNRNQSFLDIMPPFIAYGIICGIHMPLILGLKTILVPLFDIEKFDDLFIKHKPAHFLGVPAHYEKLSTSPKMTNCDLSFLESAGVGGDSLSIQMENQINNFLSSHKSKYNIAKGYGMTEVGSAAVACHGSVNKIGSVGIPHCKTVVSVFDPDTEKELTYNQAGEICISTSAMMIGYVANEQETNKVIKKHKDGSLWVHSGDIGYMDRDGFVFIKGRIKRMIIRPDGHNVFPMSIENIILEHRAVKKCAVVGKSDKEHIIGKWPVAFIVLKNSFRKNATIIAEIEELCNHKIPPRDTAVEFFEIDELPYTDNGKIDYRALEQLAQNDIALQS